MQHMLFKTAVHNQEHQQIKQKWIHTTWINDTN